MSPLDELKRPRDAFADPYRDVEHDFSSSQSDSSLNAGFTSTQDPTGAIDSVIPSTQQTRINRFRASDLAQRDIPMYQTERGDVAAVEDETGTPLLGFDSRHNIAYDSKGQPREISYGTSGPPVLKDPFANLPSRIDEKTGAIGKYGKGLYQYEGQDAATTANLVQESTDKAIQKQSALLGRKITLEEHDLTVGEKEHKRLTEDLMGQVGALRDPKYAGADQDTVLKAIDDHFNVEYGAAEANASKGWFSKDLSDEALAVRADIDQRKAGAIDSAKGLFGLKDRMNELTGSVGAAREEEQAQVETLLAHQRGEKGPLDLASNEAKSAAPGLYPPEEDQARMLGGQPLEPDKVMPSLGAAAPVKVKSTPVADLEKPFVESDTRSYRVGEDKSFHLDPNNMMKGLRQGIEDGIIDPEKAKTITPKLREVQDAINEQKAIVEAAGGAAKVKALTHGVGIGAAFLVGAGPGAEAGAAIGVAAGIPTGGISIAAAAIIGGLIGGSITSFGAKKLIDRLAKSDDTIRSFTAAAELHPYYDAAGGIVSFGAGIPTKGAQALVGLAQKTGSKAAVSIAESYLNSSGGLWRTVTNLAEDASIRTAGGASAATVAKAIGARVGGAAAINVAIDTTLNEGAKALGFQGEGETLPKAAQAALIGAFLSGHGIRFKNYDQNAMADILVRAKGAMNQGKDINTVLNPKEAEAFDAFATELRRKVNTGEIPIDIDAVAGTVRQALQGNRPYGVAAAEIKGKGGTPGLPDGGAKPAGPATEPPAPKGPAAPKASNEAVVGEKPVTERVVETKPEAGATTPQVTKPVVTPETPVGETQTIATAEKAFVEQGGHADKLEGQTKLKALRVAFPDPAARMVAIQERLAPTVGTADTSKPDVDQAAHTAATSSKNDLAQPTQAQKIAGNYQKGHVAVGGLDISIENPAGSKRKPEFAPLQSHYGYVKGTVGADKDHVDIFVAQKTPADYSGPVFVVNQYKKDGTFDEHKAVAGVATAADAKAEYQSNYQKGWTGGKSVIQFENPAAFKEWATSGRAAKGQPAIDPRLKGPVGKAAAELHLTYGGKDAAGLHLFHDTSTARATTFTVVPDTVASVEANALRSKVNQVRSKSGSPAESKVAKLAMGAMKKHEATLTNLGHSTIPKLGVTDTESGVQAKTEGGKTVITIDPKKLAKATAGLNERGQSKFVQRAIEEEILHVAGETWERLSHENADKVKEWGKSPDELSTHLEKSYEGWENLSDRQKGHEKLRAVLQKRWTGKLTEAAYRVLREFLKYLRGIYEKLTPGQREIVDGVEAILKGEPKIEYEIRSLQTGKTETVSLPVKGSWARKPTKLAKASNEAAAPVIDDKASKALDTAFEGLFAALPSRLTPTKTKAITLLETVLTKNFPDWRSTPKANLPSNGQRLIEQLLKQISRQEALGAASPVTQQAIPAEKIGGFVAAAQELVRQSIDTPQKLAALLESRYQGKARPFSQALWDMLGTVKPALRGTHDWAAIYLATPKASDEAVAPGTAAPAMILPQNSDQLTSQIALNLQTGPVTRKQLTELAKESGLSVKEVDEAAELGIVQAAREIAHGEGTPEQKFDQLVELYDRQPNLTAKTSTSKVNQAYSTPAPLAYAAGVMAGLLKAKSAYEPTAGNGLLTIAGDPKIFDVNELDPARAKNLEGQGFRTVTSRDAVDRLSDMNWDAVIANPPFGTILDDSGESREFPLARTDDTTKNIDQAIAMAALTHMKADGRAVLILGGKNIKDPEERAKAYATPNQMKFWKPLYEQYQVVDHFTVDGDLYSKQGAGWPVDVVVIAGRGRSQIQLPSADGPRILGSWDELRNEISRTDADRIDAGRYDAEKDRERVGGIVGAIRGIAGSEPAARPEIDTQRPETVDGGARSSTDLARPDPGQQPAVSRGPGTGEVSPGREPGSVGPGAVAGKPEQQLGSFRVPYQPASKLPSFGIFVPTNMEVPAREALAVLEKQVGSIDAYVLEKLGYPADAPLERYFSAEQMDALALGVNAIENQTAFVLGDQGGVGKGRVAAGMMRYAIKQGKLPIFITKDVKLYAAMVEDLHDIGSDDIVPLFTDNDLAFEDYANHKWKQGNMRDVMKQIAKTGKLYGAEALFTTYSQIQTDLPSKYSASKAERASLKAAHKAPPDGVRMEALKRLAPGSIIIADESHLAAGDSIRAWRLAPLLAQAHGVYYSSATFAKRPDSMGIYSRTSLSHATSSMEDLVSAMRQGGVPLQQVVSATLASDGLYLRRERDFGHAVFRTHINMETRDRDTGLADNYTDGLRSILSISNKMENARKYLNKILRREGKQMHVENPPRVETTNFASKLHNLISQYLFAIKAEATVRRVVEGVTNGFTNVEGETKPHKVVVTFQNTMEQPILALERSRRPLTFNGMLLHYLDSQRILTSGRGPAAQTIVITDTPNPEFERYSDRDLQRLVIIPNPKNPEEAGVNEPALAELFRRIMAGVFKETEAKLEALDLADMPLSPIDHLRRQLTQAGIKVAEITKRGTGIDEDGAIYKLDPSTNSKAAHLRYLKDFNDGDTQVLLMNASGSTGISAHASEKFKSQEPRAMLIVQPHLDINEFMQTLYRIDRTGQIHQPYYELLQTAIPAELRPAAILGRKMASLNANTTSNAENEISTGNQGTDIFNQYGDEVVYNYLKSDRVFLGLLDMPKITDDNGSIIPIDDVAALYEENGQFAAAVTGRAAVLPTSEQEVFWEKVMADYVAHIDYLNELGENELVSDTVDLKAETLESKELTPAKQGESGFDAPSVLEKIKADIGLKPLQASEVITMMEKLGENAYDIRQDWMAKADTWKATELARLKEKVLSWDDEKQRSYEARWREQEEEISAAIDLIGDGLHIKTEKGMDGYGAITEVKFDDEHPLTPSKQIFTVHVNTTKKTLRVPASQLPSIARLAVGDFSDVYESTAERSNQRYMITGNLLAAYLAIRDAAPTAKIVQYTTDKGDLRQGILMPAKFSPGSLSKKRVVDSPQHMLKLLLAGRSLTNAGGEVTLVKAPSGGYVMRVPSSRTMGGAYWRDAQLGKLMEGGEFIERGGAMIGKFGNDNSHLVYQRLLDLNASLFFTEEGEALGAARPVRAAKEFGASIEAVTKEVGMTAKESFRMLTHLVSPTTNVAMDAHDRVMKMLAERNQKAYETDRVLEAARKGFDDMPRPEQIAFIDRMKQGEPQPTPDLMTVANTMRKIDTESWDAATAAYKALGFKDAAVPLKWLENHYRVLWKKIPGSTEAEKSEWIGRSRRGLRGSMGQHKQHTLETMSDGLTMGGVPYSYNPVEMFKIAQADLWKLTSTLHTWKWAKDNGFVEFVRGSFPKAPEGMVELDDSIARVYFPAESGEGIIMGGKYFVEEGFGRLLNNYLSKDYIRATRLGRGLMWLKNATTSIELSMSPFHAVFETLEMVGSSIGLGLTQLVNRGIRKGDLGAAAQGIHNMTTGAIASPVTGFLLGNEIRKAAADPEAYFKTEAGKKMLKTYPRAREMIDDMFVGGWKPNELEQDWKNKSIRTFIESVEDIRAGASDNYIGAGLRAFPAANEMLMKPLFDVYIPSLKVAVFFKEYAEALIENERKLKGGVLTRAALSRQVWDFVENRFGEMNFDKLFWNSNFKTAMQLMFRSVTWKLGSLQAFGGAFSGQGKEFMDAMRERRAPELHRNMAWLFGMFLLTATLGAIISMVLGQKKPESLTDYVFPQIDPKDDKVRVSLPTYFKDMVHLLHSPTSYVTSSMSGWIGRVADLLRNKDYFGVQIRDTDDPLTKQALQVGKYTGETLLPFSIRGYKNLSAQDVGALRKTLALLAINPAPRHVSQTPAEKTSEAYWKGRATEAGLKPEQFESKAEKRRLVQQIKHGQVPNISAALAAGTIKPRDIKAIYERAHSTALVSQVKHMPLEDAEKVFAKANAKEKADLAQIMATKRSNRYKRDRLPFKGF